MMQGLRLIVTSYKMTTLASFPVCRRNSLATSTSSNNYVRKLAVYQSNFRTLSRDKSKMQSCHAFKHHIHTHSIDSTTLGTLHNDFCSKDFWFASVVEPTASTMGPSGGSHSRKIHITCTNLIFSYCLNETLHPYTVWTCGSCKVVLIWLGNKDMRN